MQILPLRKLRVRMTGCGGDGWVESMLRIDVPLIAPTPANKFVRRGPRQRDEWGTRYMGEWRVWVEKQILRSE